jgi:hypothetical protein
VLKNISIPEQDSSKLIKSICKKKSLRYILFEALCVKKRQIAENTKVIENRETDIKAPIFN